MVNTTPNLGLPYLLAAQSQKHVTHNEALRALDTLLQISIADRDLIAPPATPAEGDRYIVAAGATGAWAGHAASIAAYQDAGWIFYPPKEGWLAWIADENVTVAFDGAAWTSFSGGVTDHGALTGLSDDDHPQYHTNARGDARYTPLNPATLGVNATADATTRLAVGAAASLFNHPGSGGHQVKVNKAAASDTASFLFQTGFSGRAEIGTTGDDDFHFKVSANGTAWNDAILINKTTGGVTFPNTTTSGVTSVATGAGLTGGPIVSTGTIALANMAAGTLKGNNTGASAAPADLTVAQVKTMLNLSGSNSGDQTITLSGDVSGSGTGAISATIGNNAVTNAKLASMAAATLKGNATGATANAADLTPGQVAAMLPAFGASGASHAQGLVPDPGASAGTTRYLREDGSWIAPPGGGGGSPGGANGQVQYNSSGAFAGFTVGGDASLDPSTGTLTLAANAVSNAKAAQMPANTLKGNNTGSAANAADLTVTQVQAMLTAEPTVQVFTASGTWTRPAGCRRVRVRAIGGGGGGAGATAASSASCCGGGGAAGAFGEGIYDVTATASVTVTIGTAGAAGAAANGTGGTGGQTSFGALLTAPGGPGGVGMTSGTAAAFALGGASPAAGTGGAINPPGSGGGNAQRVSATVFLAGSGAGGAMGGGPRGSTAAAAGTAGSAPGAGGSGAASSSATGFAGGAGAAGLIVVEEFY